MGKLSGDIKMEQDSEIVRKYEFGLKNVPEETWINWSRANFQRITATQFKSFDSGKPNKRQ